MLGAGGREEDGEGCGRVPEVGVRGDELSGEEWGPSKARGDGKRVNLGEMARGSEKGEGFGDGGGKGRGSKGGGSKGFGGIG